MKKLSLACLTLSAAVALTLAGGVLLASAEEPAPVATPSYRSEYTYDASPVENGEIPSMKGDDDGDTVFNDKKTENSDEGWSGRW